MVNNSKGRMLWEKTKAEFIYIQTELEDCLQPNLLHPTQKPEAYSEFWKCYFQNGFEEAARKYCRFDWDRDTTKKRYLFQRYKKAVLRRLISRKSS